MNEAVTKRFLLYFRLMLLVWILIANAIIHVTGPGVQLADLSEQYHDVHAGRRCEGSLRHR
ncbi:MAG: hypothetical protein V8R88_07230 [Faecalibacterium prausnitzii]